MSDQPSFIAYHVHTPKGEPDSGSLHAKIAIISEGKIVLWGGFRMEGDIEFVTTQMRIIALTISKANGIETIAQDRRMLLCVTEEHYREVLG